MPFYEIIARKNIQKEKKLARKKAARSERITEKEGAMLALGTAAKERETLSLPAKASFFSIGTNILSKGISILFTSIFTRILLPSEFGEYTVFASWVGIASAISTFELCGSVLYRGMQRWRSEYESFLSSALGLLSVFLLSSVEL